MLSQYLKKLKYLLSQTETFQYCRILLKIFIKHKRIHLVFKQKSKFLGNFKTRVNILNTDEILSLNKDLDYIQGFRYFISKKSIIFIHSSSSNLIYNFFSKTLNCKTFVCKNNFLTNYEKNKNLNILSNKNFFRKIKKLPNINNESIFISEGKIDDNISTQIQNMNYIFLKNEAKFLNYKLHKYIYDSFGKINFENKFYRKFFLYSKNSLIIKNKKNKITGIACLKNLDLYPFDICYESALLVVDELIIGIDKDCFEKNPKYKLLLNTFLNQTKYRKKIKIIFFDFFSSTTNKCETRGRWIADVFNKISNLSKNKYLMLCGADELFDASLKSKLTKKILSTHDEVVLKFYHFVFNFKQIRDPNYAAYNYWNRIVKSEKYISNGDGMGFRKNDYFYPNKKFIDSPVFHIGYIINMHKKIKTHLNKKSGVFGNRWKIKSYMQLMKPIGVNKEIYQLVCKNIHNYKYLNGYKILKEYM